MLFYSSVTNSRRVLETLVFLKSRMKKLRLKPLRSTFNPFLKDTEKAAPVTVSNVGEQPLSIKIRIFYSRKSVSSRLSSHARLPNCLKTRIGIVTGMSARVSHSPVTCPVWPIEYRNVILESQIVLLSSPTIKSFINKI